jgi:hypothetical protein
MGVQNHRLNKNAASQVKVRQKKRPGTGMRNFSPAEAASIFEAAEREKSEVYRWVPALMALSGARVSFVLDLSVSTRRWAFLLSCGWRNEIESLLHRPLEP